MNGHYATGDTVLGNWTLARLIGEGSYGKVYEAQREDFGITYKAAIKIITIPQSESEIKNARSEGMDEASVTAYFRSFVEEIVQEFVLMSKLKGNSNVVSYEDHTVIPHNNGVGWDIIIRMELLAPLLDYVQTHSLNQEGVIKLGIDLCKALELCQKFNIVHRDIKPENIFISQLGDYKLGDFGIARTVEKTTGGLSKKGTYTYMAPEVYKEEAYGPSVDMYSLGIVMYRLLNGNRAPFLPPYPAPITHSDRENAMAKRMTGASFPRPRNADERLTEIVLKACAYQPSVRYATPTEMRQALEAVLSGHEEPAAREDIRTANTVHDFTAPEAPQGGGEEGTVGTWSVPSTEGTTEQSGSFDLHGGGEDTVGSWPAAASQNIGEEHVQNVSAERPAPAKEDSAGFVQQFTASQQMRLEQEAADDKNKAAGFVFWGGVAAFVLIFGYSLWVNLVGDFVSRTTEILVLADCAALAASSFLLGKRRAASYEYVILVVCVIAASVLSRIEIDGYLMFEDYTSILVLIFSLASIAGVLVSLKERVKK